MGIKGARPRRTCVESKGGPDITAQEVAQAYSGWHVHRVLRVRVRASWSPPFDHKARVCVMVSMAYTTPGAKWP